jgi:hypothetical protein
MEMKFISLKKWSWVLCLVLLAAPAWGADITLGTDSSDVIAQFIRDFPEEASEDVFGSGDFTGSLVSNSLYPDGATGNKVIVSGVPNDYILSMDFVAGGWSSRDSAAEVTSNEVTISGGKIHFAVLGGVSEIKSVKYNTVTISGDQTIVGSDDRSAENYALHPGQVYGGYVVSSDANEAAESKANAEENHVKITGGTIRGPVIGGFVQGPLESVFNPYITTAGSGDALNNEVVITGGTLEYSIYGGKVGSGDAKYNKISIGGSLGAEGKWVSMDEIIGGHSWAGTVEGNKVKILTPLKLSDDAVIIGGKADPAGKASDNIVDIQASVDAREIIGGWGHSEVKGNRVRLWAKKDTTIKVGPPKDAAAVSLDIKAGQGDTSAGNIVEIYGNVSFPVNKVNLYGDKLILAKPKATNAPLSVGTLAFNSFDIFVRSYTTANDVVVSADKANLGTDADLKVYSFALAENQLLYLISADTELDGNVSVDEDGLIWGTNANGGVIKLKVTSDDNRLAVSSDLTALASVDAIVFDVTAGYSDKSETISVNSDDNFASETISDVRPVGRFFTVVDKKKVKLNDGLPVKDSYEGKIFVDFSNGATAVATVKAKVSQRPDPEPTPPTPSPTPDPDPDPDPTPTPVDPVVELPVDDAVVADDTATVTVEITPEQISTAIDEAIAEAGAAGAGTVPTVSIPVKVDLPAGTDAEEIKEAKVEIALATLEAIVDKAETEEKDVALKITAIDTDTKLNVGEITLNTASLTDLITAAGEATTVELVITKSETKLEAEKKLTAAQVTALSEVEDDDRVFDVSLLVGGEPIDFATTAGKLTVALPYTLGPGESKDYLNVYYIPTSGPKQPVSETDRSKVDKILFTTNHLSVYALFYEPKVNPDPPAPPAEDSGGGCDAGFGAAAGLFFAAAYLIARKSAKR